MATVKLNPISFKITTGMSIIPVKDLFNSEEIVLIPQDSENDGNIFVATNPNSIDIKTSNLSPTVTALIGNNYTDFEDVDNADNVIVYTSTDSTGIIAGETVQISQGLALYQTTVISNESNVITLNQIPGEPLFGPSITDTLIFSHPTWYYVSSNLDKVAISDKFEITLDDDSSTQVKTVVYKDSTHIGFQHNGLNCSYADTLSFYADMKLDGFGVKLQSSDYSNGLLIKHSTTDSTVFNLVIYPKSEYNNCKAFFF